MDALLVPVLETERDLLRGPLLLLVLHLLHEQPHLLAELPQRLEPVVAAVLVSVADEELVEERVDVLELRLVLVGGGHDFLGGEGERGNRGGGHICG